jgi:hypothetical protein
MTSTFPLRKNKNMEIGNAWVVIHNNGNNVEKRGITPAEAVILNTAYGKMIGGKAVTQLKITGDAEIATAFDEEGKPTETKPRTNAQEARRLIAKYGEKVVEKLFPGAMSVKKLPETFAEAEVNENEQWQQTNANPDGSTKYEAGKLREEDCVFISTGA